MMMMFKKWVSAKISRLFDLIGIGTDVMLGEGAPVVLSFVGRLLYYIFSAVGKVFAWTWETIFELVELIIRSYQASLGYGRYKLWFRPIGSVIAAITTMGIVAGVILSRGFSWTCIKYAWLSSNTQGANEYGYKIQNWDAYREAWAEKNAFIANSKIASFLSSLNDSFGEKLLQFFLIAVGICAFIFLCFLVCYFVYKAFAWTKVLAEKKVQREKAARERRKRADMVDNVIKMSEYRRA